MSTILSPWDDLAIPPQARGRGVTLTLFDQLSAYVPKRPGAYVRISSDRFDLEAGVDRQNDDAEVGVCTVTGVSPDQGST